MSVDFEKVSVIAHRVLLKVEKNCEEKKVGSIVIPPAANAKKIEAHEKGTVVNMGETVFMDVIGHNPLKIGDRVAFKKYAGCDLTQYEEHMEGKEEYRIINDEDILVIF